MYKRQDDDDELADGEEIIGMAVPNGSQLQISPSLALNVSLVNRGVLVRLGIGWFGGVITREAQKKHNRLEYGYRFILDVDQSTHSMKLPQNAYGTEENSVVGAWVLLERSTVPSRVSRSGRALTSNIRDRRKELSVSMLSRTRVTSRAPYYHRYCVRTTTVRTVVARGHLGYIPGL